MRTVIHQAYHNAVDADEAWSHELIRLFGKNAGDIRYTAQGRGEYGTHLRALHDNFIFATARWRELIDNFR